MTKIQGSRFKVQYSIFNIQYSIFEIWDANLKIQDAKMNSIPSAIGEIAFEKSGRRCRSFYYTCANCMYRPLRCAPLRASGSSDWVS